MKIESLVQDLSQKGVWTSTMFFSQATVLELLKLAHQNYSLGKFHPAQIGKGILKQTREDIRKDQICWIDARGVEENISSHFRGEVASSGYVANKNLVSLEESKAPSAVLLFKSQMEELKRCLSRELFLPLKRFEAHFARYDVGAFYKKHIDRHSIQPHRVITAVLYLNDVSQTPGGELVLFNGKDIVEIVQPTPGLFVLFDSRIPHEVKPTQNLRWSLTGWFRDDELLF